MLPFDKHICDHRIHCPACRDLSDGRKWRTAVAHRFDVPPQAPDWECPRGLAWAVPPRTTLAGLVRDHAARRAGCPSCQAAHAARLAAQRAAK